jgi:undecaprenyl diphosphate synthase
MGELAIGQHRAVAPFPPSDKLTADAARVPSHVAIIMDGNGRWAASRGLPRVAGHRAGVQAVRRTIEAAMANGVGWLTLYAFSSENWRRPVEEVSDLTGLLRRFIKSELAELGREGVRMRFIGDRTRFDRDIQAELARAELATVGNTRLNLVVALSYGARGEIVAAVQAAIAAAAEGRLDASSLTEESFARLLSTKDIPDPDLILRTSGEQRLSNFLLWQSAYAELIFNEVLWPDFTAEHFEAAIAEFGRRERRFGARPG